MGSFSDYLEAALLDHFFGKTEYTFPTVTVCYVALCTAASDSAITEVANSNNYARKSTAPADWNAASGTAPCVTTNANAITFPAATGSWGTPGYFALMDSGTYGAGNILAWGEITTPTPIGDGDTAEFAAGDLSCQLD